MKTVIATRSLNQDLFAFSSSLVQAPFPRVLIKETSADGYFYSVMQLDADWVVNMDEDIFLWDFSPIVELLKHMQDTGFHCCGMPDGGMISHRHFNPLVPNAFFNILNIAAMKEHFSIEAAAASVFDDDLKRRVPASLLKPGQFQFTEYEPYYRFFYWMLKQGFKMLYLDAIQWVKDPISTILLDHLRKPMLLHCWYARAFAEQRPRFDQAFNYCRALQKSRLEKRE